jgi:hypothetical protein
MSKNIKIRQIFEYSNYEDLASDTGSMYNGDVEELACVEPTKITLIVEGVKENFLDEE